MELKELCGRIGYRSSDTQKALERIPGLVGLTIMGGPALPTGNAEWRARREAIRDVLRDVAKKEVRDQLGDLYSYATTKVFRLDEPRPLGWRAHRKLNEIQACLDVKFGGDEGGREFLNNHRPALFDVIVGALQARERQQGEKARQRVEAEAASADKGKSAAPQVRAKPKSGHPRQSTSDKGRRRRQDPSRRIAAEKRRVRDASSPKALRKRPLPAKTPKPSPASPPKPAATVSSWQQIKPWTKGWRLTITIPLGLILILSLVVLAVALIFGRPVLQPRLMTPMRFSVQVEDWLYKRGDSTEVAQIKIKPRLVNRSLRTVDLRLGRKARIALAIVAPSPPIHPWLSSTRPRYRRYGDWLLVPPKGLGAGGLSWHSRDYESDLTVAKLGPFESYAEASGNGGSLVFDVPPELSFTNGSPRIAYRLPSGQVYFPLGGAFAAWRGPTGTNF